MSTWQLYTIANTALAVTVSALQSNRLGYRPSQWSSMSSNESQLIYLKTNIGGYFFDAILRTEHITSLRITEHPAQDGANITDHAYQLPAQLMIEIGMSDAMQTFLSGQFGGAGGKSVSAYQTLVDLQKARTPLTVVTRLNSYDNILVEQIAAPDDYRVATGLRAMVTLRQIIMATVATKTVKSVAPQTTEQTNKGEVQAEKPTGSAASFLPSWAGGTQ